MNLLELKALRVRLDIARETHRQMAHELERLQKKPGGASAFALDVSRQRLETALRELKAARQALLTLVR